MEMLSTRMIQIGLVAKITHTLTKPSWFLQLDETGCNTNQTRDSNICNTKVLDITRTKAQQQANTSDHRATVLPITAAIGETLTYVVIFESNVEGGVQPLWASGINIRITPIMDESAEVQFGQNYGCNKYFPGLLVCKFQGRTIHPQVYVSPHGGITGEILLQVFKRIDELDLFPRDNGVYPCVLLDGHNSRLYEPFIKYINSPTTKWGFILGIPYGTSYWQVADTTYLNGWFKCLWYREKKKLVTFKAIRGLPINMGVTDIVPCLRPALEGSFGVIENVKKALSICGWNPLNRGALVHPDMVI